MMIIRKFGICYSYDDLNDYDCYCFKLNLEKEFALGSFRFVPSSDTCPISDRDAKVANPPDVPSVKKNRLCSVAHNLSDSPPTLPPAPRPHPTHPQPTQKYVD
jgi:hypothetical protein